MAFAEGRFPEVENMMENVQGNIAENVQENIVDNVPDAKRVFEAIARIIGQKEQVEITVRAITKKNEVSKEEQPR